MSKKLYMAHLDLLYQCDLDCEHCYLDDKGSRNQKTAFWKDVLDQLADMGVFKVILSGGELFLRPDALELIRYARSLGLAVRIKTHGGTLDQETIEALGELSLMAVDLSYYSHRPEVHDAITRKPGSYARTHAAIEGLVAAGVRTIASLVVMDINVADVPESIATLRALGAQPKLGVKMKPAHSGDTFPIDRSITQADLLEIEEFLQADEGSSICSSGERSDWAEHSICGAGHTGIYVNPEGKVSPCLSWPVYFGDLTRGDRLADLWQGSEVLDEVRSYRNGDRKTCSSCGLKDGCSYCPGDAYTENRDALNGSDSMCEQTTMRAQTRAQLEGTGPVPQTARRSNPFVILSSSALAGR
jgi:radical SAM protein with 4Fe4S-binding SPASM domain